jgi:protein subunit release factor A
LRSLKKSKKKLIEKYESVEKLEKQIKEEGVPPDDHTAYNDLLEWRATRYELEELTFFIESI